MLDESGIVHLFVLKSHNTDQRKLCNLNVLLLAKPGWTEAKVILPSRGETVGKHVRQIIVQASDVENVHKVAFA